MSRPFFPPNDRHCISCEVQRMNPPARHRRTSPRTQLTELGKLCTGRRAGADGWLSQEEASGEPGVGLLVAAREMRGTGSTSARDLENAPRLRQQLAADEVEIRQREETEGARQVLGEAAIADLGEAPQPLHDV